jgi:hypothetical protein
MPWPWFSTRTASRAMRQTGMGKRPQSASCRVGRLLVGQFGNDERVEADHDPFAVRGNERASCIPPLGLSSEARQPTIERRPTGDKGPNAVPSGIERLDPPGAAHDGMTRSRPVSRRSPWPNRWGPGSSIDLDPGPASPAPGSLRSDLAGGLHGVEDQADRLVADARYRSADVADREARRRLLEDESADPLLLAGAARFSLRGDAVLEAVIGLGERRDQKLRNAFGATERPGRSSPGRSSSPAAPACAALSPAPSHDVSRRSRHPAGVERTVPRVLGVSDVA